MKKILLSLLMLVTAGSIIAYNNYGSEETVDIALAANSARGGIYEIDAVSKPASNMAVDFTWKDESGNDMSFKELTKDKVVFLNFWGTWCPPCRREIPDIVSIGNDYANEDFIILGIALEKSKNPEKNLSKFMESNKMTYHNFLANEDIKRAYGGISAVPTTYIIDKNGKIVEKIVGMKSKEEFVKSIKKVLK